MPHAGEQVKVVRHQAVRIDRASGTQAFGEQHVDDGVVQLAPDERSGPLNGTDRHETRVLRVAVRGRLERHVPGHRPTGHGDIVTFAMQSFMSS